MDKGWIGRCLGLGLLVGAVVNLQLSQSGSLSRLATPADQAGQGLPTQMPAGAGTVMLN